MQLSISGLGTVWIARVRCGAVHVLGQSGLCGGWGQLVRRRVREKEVTLASLYQLQGM